MRGEITECIFTKLGLYIIILLQIAAVSIFPIHKFITGRIGVWDKRTGFGGYLVDGDILIGCG